MNYLTLGRQETLPTYPTYLPHYYQIYSNLEHIRRRIIDKLARKTITAYSR